MGIPQPAGQIKEHPFVSLWSSGRVAFYEEAIINEVLGIYASDLTEEDLKSWKHLMNQQMKKIFTSVEKPQLTTIALKNRVWVADDSVAPLVSRHPFHG